MLQCQCLLDINTELTLENIFSLVFTVLIHKSYEHVSHDFDAAVQTGGSLLCFNLSPSYFWIAKVLNGLP